MTSDNTFSQLTDDVLVRPNNLTLELYNSDGELLRKYPMPRVNRGMAQALAAKFISANRIIYQYYDNTLNYIADSICVVADTFGNIHNVVDISKLPVFNSEKTLKYHAVIGDFVIQNCTNNILFDRTLNSVILILRPTTLKGAVRLEKENTPIVYAIDIDNGNVIPYPIYRHMSPDAFVTNKENEQFADLDAKNHILYIANGKDAEIECLNLLDRSLQKIRLSSKYVESSTVFHSTFRYPPFEWEDKISSYCGIWIDTFRNQLLRTFCYTDSTKPDYGGHGLLALDLNTGQIREGLYPYFHSKYIWPTAKGLVTYNFQQSKFYKDHDVLEYVREGNVVNENEYRSYLTKVRELNFYYGHSPKILNIMPDSFSFMNESTAIVLNLDSSDLEVQVQLRQQLLGNSILKNYTLVLLSNSEQTFRNWITPLSRAAQARCIYVNLKDAEQKCKVSRNLEYYSIMKGKVLDFEYYNEYNIRELWPKLAAK